MYFVETQCGNDPFVTGETGYAKQCDAEAALKVQRQMWKNSGCNIRFRVRYIDFAQFLRDCIDLARWDHLSCDL